MFAVKYFKKLQPSKNVTTTVITKSAHSRKGYSLPKILRCHPNLILVVALERHHRA